MSDLYYSHPYGSQFYGSQTPSGIVPLVRDFYVIREPGYYILKWTAPANDASGTPVSPQAYIISRTEHANTLNSTQIAVISTTDISGAIDTCYADSTLPDTTKDYYYSVVVINQAGYPSFPTPWMTDYLLPNVSNYISTGLYTSQKLNYFYSILNTLKTYTIFDTEKYVVPNKNITVLENGTYVPDNDYLYLDFFPNAPSGTVFDVYLNSQKIMSGISRDYFYVTLPYIPNKQSFTLDIRNQATYTYSGNTTPAGTLFRTRTYTSYDYLIFPAAVAAQLNITRNSIEVLKNNLWKDECSLNLIYQNFGSFFSYPPPPYLITTEYAATVVGDGATRPGLVTAGMDGGTILGISEAIQSITGQHPEVAYYRDTIGWTIRENKSQPIAKMCLMRYNDADTSTAVLHQTITNGGYYPGSWGGLTVWGTNEAVTGEEHVAGAYGVISLDYPPVPYVGYPVYPFPGPDPARITAYYYTLAGKQTLQETNSTSPGTGFFYVSYAAQTIKVNAGLIGKEIYVDYYNVQSSAQVYWGGNGSAGGVGWPVGYTNPFKNFTLHVKVHGSMKTVTQEAVVCSGATDYLAGGNVLLNSPIPEINPAPPPINLYPALEFTVTDALGYTYTMADFHLDTDTGSIIWRGIIPSTGLPFVSPNPCPINRIYYVNYTFSYVSSIKNIVNQIKFPQTNIIYQWL